MSYKYWESDFITIIRYDVELYQRIEQLIGKKLPLHPTVEEEVMSLMERVAEAQRHAKMVGCYSLQARLHDIKTMPIAILLFIYRNCRQLWIGKGVCLMMQKGTGY